MSFDMKDLELYVEGVLNEVKKKKEKAIALKKDEANIGYTYAEEFDFSAPLGQYNLYRTQGAVNWGPMTSAGTKIDDRISGQRSKKEEAKVLESVEFRTLAEAAERTDEGPWDYAKSMAGQAAGGIKKAAGSAWDKLKGMAGKVAEPVKQAHQQAKSASAAADKTKSAEKAKKTAVDKSRKVIPGLHDMSTELGNLSGQSDGNIKSKADSASSAVDMAAEELEALVQTIDTGGADTRKVDVSNIKTGSNVRGSGKKGSGSTDVKTTPSMQPK